jgi:CRISPR-associated exonuclease Cas4
MAIYGEMEVNAAVLDGSYRHQNAHMPGSAWFADGRIYRSVYVWSEALRVAGMADFVQQQGEQIIPLEHKRGRMGKWQSDHVQLCAQAICLEERTGQIVHYGEIFYWTNRRRETVAFTAELRQATYRAAAVAFALLEAARMPDPIRHPAKCRDCSLQPVCLPEEVLILRGEV